MLPAELDQRMEKSIADNKPLSNVTVVDMSMYVTGSFATSMLANQGAEIIKIERPDIGDANRQTGPPFIEGESGYFMTVNYGKKSVELDLKTKRGRDILYELVADADVFVQNFRPGAAEALDAGYEDLREVNEDLIYCSISGFGDTGPLSGRPGHDALIQAMSGLMDVTGKPDGQPMKIGVPATDLITAMWAGFGIVNAIYRRERTGNGDYLEIAMFDAALTWLTKHAARALEGERPQRMGNKDPIAAPYQVFETADGYIAGGAFNNKLWRQFCEAIGREDLLEDDRFKTNEKRVENVEELEEELEATFRQLTTEKWLEILTEEHDIPFGPLLRADEALESEQAEARNVVREVEHSRIDEYSLIEHPIRFEDGECGFERHAPALGESTSEVLTEYDLSQDEIDELRDDGIIGGE